MSPLDVLVWLGIGVLVLAFLFIGSAVVAGIVDVIRGKGRES